MYSSWQDHLANAHQNAKTTSQRAMTTIKQALDRKEIRRGLALITLGAIGYWCYRFLQIPPSLPPIDPLDKEPPYDINTFERPSLPPTTDGWKFSKKNKMALNTPTPPVILASLENSTGKQISIVQGSIIAEGDEQRPWAITNAANGTLRGGDGVDGVIKKAAGNAPYQECSAYKRQFTPPLPHAPIGSATISRSGKLAPRIKYIIHAVGPDLKPEKSPTDLQRKQLYAAVWNTLEKADKHKVEVVSLPPLSSGIFHYPPEACAQELISASINFINTHPNTSVKEIRHINTNNNANKLVIFCNKLAQL